LFGRAAQLSPDDETLANKARFMEGRALVENRQYQQGINVLLQVVAADPDAPYTYNALGIAYMEQQQWNEAIRNFRLASDRAEKWVYPHYNLSRVYAALSRFPDAEAELRRGIALGEELGLRYSYLYYNLGILYLFQGRANDAEQQFRRAIELKPGDALSYHNLGLIYQRRNNAQEAETFFRKAADLDPRLFVAGFQPALSPCRPDQGDENLQRLSYFRQERQQRLAGAGPSLGNQCCELYGTLHLCWIGGTWF